MDPRALRAPRRIGAGGRRLRRRRALQAAPRATRGPRRRRVPAPPRARSPPSRSRGRRLHGAPCRADGGRGGSGSEVPSRRGRARSRRPRLRGRPRTRRGRAARRRSRCRLQALAQSTRRPFRGDRVSGMRGRASGCGRGSRPSRTRQTPPRASAGPSRPRRCRSRAGSRATRRCRACRRAGS